MPPAGIAGMPPGVMPAPFLGPAGAPAIGGAPGLLPAGAGGPGFAPDAWINLREAPGQVYGELSAGDVLECVTTDSSGVMDGTVAFLLELVHPADPMGRYLEACCIGCQVTSHLVSLSILFPPGGQGGRPGVVHLCAGDRSTCSAIAPGRQVFHVDCLRRREPSLLHEGWISVPGVRGGIRFDGGAPSTAAGEDDEKLRRLKQRLNRGEATLQDRIAYQNLQKRQARGRSRERRRKRSRSRRRRRRRSSSTTTSQGSGASGSLFRAAPGRGGTLRNDIRSLADRHPGRLYESALAELSTKMGARPGGSSGDPGTSWIIYLNGILSQKYRIEKPVYHELMTLATGLNSLGRGEPERVGDLLVQRWKSIEARLSGHPEAAAPLELVDGDETGVLGREELRRAQRSQMGLQRLQDLRGRIR